MADYQDTYGVLRSNFLIGLIRIAAIPANRFDYTKSLIESTPLNIPGITCRVWVLDAIQRLMDAELFRCLGIGLLESEAGNFGLIEDPRNSNPRIRQARVSKEKRFYNRQPP